MDRLPIWERNMEISREKRDRQKDAVRREIAALRKKTTAEERGSWDQAIKERLLSRPGLERFSGVYSYISIRGEAGTKGILEELWSRNIPVAVPKVLGKTMEFFQITSWNDVSPGRMGILEPDGQGKLPENFGQNPLILVPAVGLDQKGNRIGYGGGYYDRFLAGLKDAAVIALAYEFQIYQEIPAEAHDRPVDEILTPDRLIICRRDR